MLITRISLNNFKCFRQVDINFSKLTLLLGANSSGKSSLIYAILAILQSEDFPLYLSPNGNYVNMGDFEEISFKHDKRNKLEISFSISRIRNKPSNLNLNTVWINNLKNNMPQLKYLKLTSDFFNVEVRKDNHYYNLDLKYNKTKDPFLDPRLDKLLTKFIYDIDVQLQIKSKKPKRFVSFSKEMEKKQESIKNLKFRSIPDLQVKLTESKKVISQAAILNLIRFIRGINDKFNYISSFREYPERTYYQRKSSNLKIGKHGENYIHQILEWETSNTSKLKQLISILKKINILSNIKVRKLKGGSIELRGKVGKIGVYSSLVDIGFGVSQFLPIIVADLQLPKNSTLIVSQPEIHLHPDIQAELASYFIDNINQQNKRYIIETHSEYFLNRIRLGIVRGHIKPSDVSIYFFENDINGSKKFKIECTKAGQIKNAPDSFFQTYMMDVMNIALNA